MYKINILKEQKKELKAEIKNIEASLKHAYTLSKVDDWIKTDFHRFRLISTNGRKTLNRESLVLELEKLFHKNQIPLKEIEGLLARSETASEPSFRLTIKEIKE